MMENSGPSYRIKAKRAASHHGEHTQVTQATAWANQVKGQMHLPGMATVGGHPPVPRDSDWYRDNT